MSVHAQEEPIPVGRVPAEVVLGRPLRDPIEGGEGGLVSPAQLPPLPVDMRFPCSYPDKGCVQVSH
jgi:hypothetical protein